jgi:hypothetical protein
VADNPPKAGATNAAVWHDVLPCGESDIYTPVLLGHNYVELAIKRSTSASKLTMVPWPGNISQEKRAYFTDLVQEYVHNFIELDCVGVGIAYPDGAGLPPGATAGHSLTSRIPKVSS